MTKTAGMQKRTRLYLASLALMVASTALALIAVSVSAQETNTESSQSPAPFFFREIETQLQKKLLNIEVADSRSCYFLKINATMLQDAKELGNIESVFGEIESQLKAVEDEGNPGVFVSLISYGEMPPSETLNEINKNLIKLTEKRFRQIGHSSSINPDEAQWNVDLDRLAKKFVRQNEEAVSGNEYVLVYPVHTAFSYSLTNGASCYVEILGQATEDNGFLDLPVREKIIKEVKTGHVGIDGALVFRLHSIVGAEGWEKKIKVELDQFARSLGFAKTNISYSPEKVERNESLNLVGREAPNFKLENFATGELESLAEIGQGKVVVLNFWGNTWGPCRTESPYLTQLQQELGVDGLVVIGIDGFSDSKEKVKEFVEATDSGYRILLNGAKVASDQYFVTAYPTTFVIDRKGIVVKRTTGFDRDDFGELKNELIRLLGE